jgi:queuine/archaeosine tRNA-ribosyltransferase
LMMDSSRTGANMPGKIVMTSMRIRAIVIIVFEILGLRLVSLHNVYFYIDLLRRVREAIDQDRFLLFKKDFLEHYNYYGTNPH